MWIKEVMVTVLLVVQKYYCDKFYCNFVVAKMANIDLKKLNKYEKQLLNLIDWQVIISSEEYDNYMLCLNYIF